MRGYYQVQIAVSIEIACGDGVWRSKAYSKEGCPDKGSIAVAKKNRLTLPIVLDPKGKTADIFGAKMTTTTVVIDSRGILRYRGQFGQRGQHFAEDALKAVLAGQEVKVKRTKEKG